MKTLLTFGLCLGFCTLLLGQKPRYARYDCYKKFMDDGCNLAKKPENFQKALQKFNSARRCDPSKSDLVEIEIDKLFARIVGLNDTLNTKNKELNTAAKKIKEQKNTADSLSNELKRKYDDLDKMNKDLTKTKDSLNVSILKIAEEKANADRLKKKAEQTADTFKQLLDERIKNDRIIKASYFYEGRFALAVKEDDRGNYKYGFINTNGDTLIGYHYDEASNFNQVDGYARVKKGNLKYLLDTTGKLYPVAETVEEINASTTILDLHDKQLTKIPPRVFRYRQLEMILLHGNQLTSLPTKLGKLTNLRSLDLRNNKNLKSLPAGLGKLTNLQSLNLQLTGLKSLPAQIGDLSQLQNLNLEYSNLESLPPEIGKLKNLQMLNLAYTRLKSVPVQFWELRNLQNLNVNSLPAFYDSIPDEIENFKKLQELKILGDRFAPEVINKIINSLPKCEVIYSKEP